MTISTTTLKKYLKAAGEIIGVRTNFDHTVIDAAPAHHKKKSEVSEMIRSVVKEHHRWEKMPNRREPITTKMVEFWIDRAKSADPDSFVSAMADWMIIGIKTGMRKSEWAQDTSIKTKSGFNENLDGSCRAFINDDFTLERENLQAVKATSTKLQITKSFDILRIR